MVGDEVLGALGNPGHVADAELVGLRERRRQRQPGRVGERTSPLGRAFSRRPLQPGVADRLGALEVEAEQVAAVVARHQEHPNGR